MDETQSHVVNRIITPCDAWRIEPSDDKQKRIFRSLGYEGAAHLLLREGAYEILIPKGLSFSHRLLKDRITPPDSPIYRRIKFIDSDYTYEKKVEDYLTPVVNDIISRNLGNEHILDINDAGELLYLLLLGSKEKAEIDMDLIRVKNRLYDLSKNLQDDEAKFRLDVLIGICNRYQNSEINCLIFNKPFENIDINNYLESIFNDIRIQEISEKKHQLGYLSPNKKILLKWLQTKKWYEQITLDSKYKGMFSIGRNFIQYMLSTFNIPIQSLKGLLHNEKQYQPICTNLNTVYQRGIEQRYNLPGMRMSVSGSWINKITDDGILLIFNDPIQNVRNYQKVSITITINE